MPVGEPLETTSYTYDGGLAGFYCCVYQCIKSRRIPDNIIADGAEQQSLLVQKYVETNVNEAIKIRKLIESKGSCEGVELVEKVFLSCINNKEITLLRFILRMLKEGKSILNKFGDPEVSVILAAAKHLGGEAHLLTGFIRFSDYNGVLVAVITPKNFILPFIADHFVKRFPKEQFLIHDKVHKAALIYQNGKKSIVAVDDIEMNEVSESEESYRSLWKQFYNTIAIENRRNNRLRMSNMPKRYWENMTEMKELL